MVIVTDNSLLFGDCLKTLLVCQYMYNPKIARKSRKCTLKNGTYKHTFHSEPKCEGTYMVAGPHPSPIKNDQIRALSKRKIYRFTLRLKLLDSFFANVYVSLSDLFAYKSSYKIKYGQTLSIRFLHKSTFSLLKIYFLLSIWVLAEKSSWSHKVYKNVNFGHMGPFK